MNHVVEDLCKETCLQLQNEEVQETIYRSVIKPLICNIVHELRFPLVLISIIVFIQGIMIVHLWIQMIIMKK